MQRTRRTAVVKIGARPKIVSFEREPQHSPSLRKPAQREAKSSIPSESTIWESRSIAVCRVNAKGEILRANRKFLEVSGCRSIADGTDANSLLIKSGTLAGMDVETIPASGDGEEFWILVPRASSTSALAGDDSGLAFRLLHDSVAQSVAALAMNLFLVKQSGATSTSPDAEKILCASLELVEQCAKEVRGICTLLQRQAKAVDRSCA
jgi:PAS domain-containing protein